MDHLKKTALNRIMAWDFLKCVAMILVIWGHLVQYISGHNYYDNPLYCWIYSFHMPLFMAISGLFATSGFYKNSFTSYFISKTKFILLPTLIWCAIDYLVSLPMIGGPFQFTRFLHAIVHDLWFLKALFINCILGYIAFRVFKNRLYGIIFTLILSTLIITYSVNVMYICFLFGIYIRHNLEKIKRNLHLILIISGSVFFVSSLLVSFIPDLWIVRTSSITIAINKFDLGSIFKILGSRYLTMIIGLVGSLFFIITSYDYFLKNHLPIWTKEIAKVGKYTFGIYTIQFCIVETILPLYIELPQMSSSAFWFVNLLIFPAISIVLTVFFAVLTSIVCKMWPLAGILLFGKKPQHELKIPAMTNELQA